VTVEQAKTSFVKRGVEACRLVWQRQFVGPMKQSAQLRYFMIIGATFGLLMVFITPPLMGFDATSHFRAVVHYAEGGRHSAPALPGSVKTVNIDATTAEVIDIAGAIQKNRTISPLIYELFWSHEGRPQGSRPVDLGGAAVYSPIAYAPPVLGVLLPKLLHLPLLLQVWGARLACLIVYLLLAYFALRALPFGKWAFFVIALLPMTIFQAATITTDGFLNGLVFLYVALILRLSFGAVPEKNVTRKLLWAIGMLGVLIALSKPVYVALAALLFLIPTSRFYAAKYRAAFLSASLGLSVALAALWNTHVKDVALTVGEVYRSGFHISYTEQLASIVHHPLHFTAVLARTIFNNGYGYFGQLVGVFDPQFTLLPIVVALPLVIAVFLGLAVDGDKARQIPVRSRMWVGLLGVAILGAIALTFYLTYSPVGAPSIDGMQGRYFIPLLILLVPLLALKNIQVTVRKPARLFSALVIVGLLVGCLQILSVNYWL
jgi:uncharacterized membrane protein